MPKPHRLGLKARESRRGSPVKKLGGKGRKDGPLTDSELLDRVLQPLTEALPLVGGDEEITRRVYTTLLSAALDMTSLDDAAEAQVDGYSSKTLYHYLDLVDAGEVCAQANRLLQQEALPWVAGHRMRGVIDLTLIPTHEKGNPVLAEIPDPKKPGQTISLTKLRHGKAKAGTTTFYAIATLYLYTRKKRFTIGFRYVMGGEPLGLVVEELLDLLPSLNVGLRYLLMDKEFYQRAIIESLITRDIPFVIAVPKKGMKIKDLAKRSDGTRFVPWSIIGTSGQPVSFRLAIVGRYKKAIPPKKGMTWYYYAVRGVSGDPRNIMERYRRRFGIESTYRMMNRCRARTSSVKLGLRLLIALLAMLICNLKFALEMELSQNPRESRRKASARMRLKRLCRRLQRAVRRWLKRFGSKRRRCVENA